MDRASSPHSRLVGGDSLSHPRCPQSLATNWQGQIDVFWQLRRQLQLHCRHWRQHEHWHFWHLPPNNSFKPNLLRSTKAMAERACHGFGSTTQVGLTQALGCSADYPGLSLKAWTYALRKCPTRLSGKQQSTDCEAICYKSGAPHAAKQA